MAARWLNSNSVLVASYLVAALVCLVVAVRERRVGRESGAEWPAFWFAIAALLVVLAIVRGDGLDSTLSSAARARVKAEGWYPRRHGVQVMAIEGLAAAWGLALVVALWRMPRPRRRYLPLAIAVLSLLSFLAVRGVSLHRVDALLRRTVRGVRLSSLLELGGVALVVVLAVVTEGWSSRVQARNREERARASAARSTVPDA